MSNHTTTFSSYAAVRASLASKHLVAEEYPAAELHGTGGGYRSTAAYTQLKRRLNDPAFLAAWREPVRDTCRSLIAAPSGPRVFCLVREYAHPFMLAVTARLVSATVEQVQRWGSLLAALADAGEEHRAAARAAAAELRAHVGRAVAEPSPDPCALLHDAALHRLPTADIVNAMTVMLAAGHHTTADMIGNAVVAFLERGYRLSSVGDDEGLTSIVEEALRFDPSVPFVERTVVSPGMIEGVAVHPGAPVAISLTAANRDRAACPHGDRFVPDAPPTRHLAFGLGASYCIGSSLARLCLREAILVLAQIAPASTLVPGSVVWKPAGALRGPSTALLEVSP